MDKADKKTIVRVLSVSLALLVLAQIWLFVEYRKDQSRLEALAAQVLDHSLPASEQVRGALEYFRNLPVRRNESYFVSPVFEFLRPPPLSVAQYGGDCADRSRLLITLLRFNDIPASKWALYDDNSASRHAVVEVMTEKGAMVVDPLYGLVFPAPDGDYFSIADLSSDPSILRDRIELLVREHEQPGAAKLEGYPVREYIYTHARTINWEKSPITRLLYRALSVMLGDRVDTINRPSFVEQPALMLLLATLLVQAVLVIVLLAVKASTRRATRAAW